MNLCRPKNILHLENLFDNVVLPQATTQQMIFCPQKVWSKKKKLLLILAKKNYYFFFDRSITDDSLAGRARLSRSISVKDLRFLEASSLPSYTQVTVI